VILLIGIPTSCMYSMYDVGCTIIPGHLSCSADVAVVKKHDSSTRNSMYVPESTCKTRVRLGGTWGGSRTRCDGLYTWGCQHVILNVMLGNQYSQLHVFSVPRYCIIRWPVR